MFHLMLIVSVSRLHLPVVNPMAVKRFRYRCNDVGDALIGQTQAGFIAELPLRASTRRLHPL